MIISAFNEFAVLLSLSVVIGFIAIKLKQPLIFSFIIVGIIAGPHFLSWITNQSDLEVLASFGVTILLFIVGLKLDIDLIKTFGLSILLIGLTQIFLTTLLGWFLGIILGYQNFAAFFIAFTLSFSSTIIIIKMLSDLFEVDSLYGRISIGILIVQDLVAILAIIVLSSLNIKLQSSAQLDWQVILIITKAILMIMLCVIARLIFPTLLEQLAKSKELLILFAIAWAVSLAAFAEYLGFSKEVGGFLAGITLASSRYREAIGSRLETVRNILLLFFFLNLGASLEINRLNQDILSAVVLSLFVLFIKPLLVFILMEMLGYSKRVSFITGLTLGQISEFSLILATLGITLGYVEANVLGLTTLICLVTIAFSTYLIAYTNIIYKYIADFLPTFSLSKSKKKKLEEPRLNDVIVYGYGRHGEYIARMLAQNKLKILAIDFDPEKIIHVPHTTIQLRYGDAEDIDFPKTLPLMNIKWIISTLPKSDVNKILVSSLKELKYAGKIALSAYHHSDIRLMKALKPDLLMVPFEDAATAAAEKILQDLALLK